MIQLNEVQSTVLKDMFEEVFDDSVCYLDLVDIDEIFSLLIGGEVHDHIYELLERTAFIDEHQVGFIILLHEWMQIIIDEAIKEDVQFFELASNCKQFKTKLNEIICTPDSGDLSER